MRIERRMASSTADHAIAATWRSARVDRSVPGEPIRAGVERAARVGKLRTPWKGTKRFDGAPGAWNGACGSRAQVVLPVSRVAMKRTSIAAAQGLQKPVTCPAFATSTKLTLGNSLVSPLAWASGMRSRSAFNTSAGTSAKRVAGANGGFGRSGAGQSMQASAAGASATGCCLTYVVQADGENGAVLSAGSALSAASYCLRRMATVARLSHANALSVQ